jgi:integrase
MPRLVNVPPRYRLHKGTGQAVVRVNGRDRYLGKYNSIQSREGYGRIVAEWNAARGSRPLLRATMSYDATVNELMAAYLDHSLVYYRKNGLPTGEIDNIRHAFRPLRRLFGETLARDFTSLGLKTVREAMIQASLARTTINARISKVKRCFKWGVAEHLVPESVYGQLAAVDNLKPGRCIAREPVPVKPVPEKVVNKTLPHLPPVVADMVRLQQLTGMRPGEVCRMRPCDVDRRRKVWLYRPAIHKMQHKNRERRIYIGPRAQLILKPYLDRKSQSFCFSPAESEQRRKAEMRTRRKTKVQPSQIDRSKPNAKRRPRERYDRHSLAHAIWRACDAAGLKRWHPNQLRHSAGTLLRRKLDADASRCVLGHSDLRTTEIYAERDFRAAELAMAKYG